MLAPFCWQAEIMSNCKIRSVTPARAPLAGLEGFRRRLQRVVTLLVLGCLPHTLLGLGLPAQVPAGRAGDVGRPVDANRPGDADKAVDAAARARAQPVVAVIDIRKVMEQYPKFIAERERLVALENTLLERIEALTKQIEQVRNDMMLEKDGSDQREWKQLEYGELQKRREVLKALLARQLEREEHKGMVTIFADIEAAIAEVARRRGVHIVLRQNPTPTGAELAKDPERAIRQKLSNYDARTVWFASEEFDLTPAVINYLKVPVVPAPAGAPGSAPAGTGDRKSVV